MNNHSLPRLLLVVSAVCGAASAAPFPRGAWSAPAAQTRTQKSALTAPEQQEPTSGPAPTPTAPSLPVSEVAAPLPAAGTPPAPFYRGTTFSYRNTVAALSFNPGAEPTYNPYYAMTLAISPRAWLSKQLYVRGSFDVSSELTQSDSTNDRFVIGDLGLAAGLDGLYTIPLVKVDVSTELAVSLPTSKGSQAATRLFSSALSLSLARKFGPVTLSYSGNVDKYWNRYTTGAPTAYLVAPCEVTTGSGCVDKMIETGRRNVNWAVSNGLNASYKASAWLSVSAGVGVSTAFLYALPEAEQISLDVKQTSDVRYLMSSSLGVSLKPVEPVTVGFGLRASYGQLAPDGGYRVPLLNRFTQLYLDVGVNLASLVAKLRS
jgi:hypothetical protein